MNALATACLVLTPFLSVPPAGGIELAYELERVESEGSASFATLLVGAAAFPVHDDASDGRNRHVLVGDELVRYARREGRRLVGIERGLPATHAAAHPAGERVELVDVEAVLRAVEAESRLEFLIGMAGEDFAALGTTEEDERARVEAWLASHSSSDVASFNALPHARGGPTQGVRWSRTRKLMRVLVAVRAPERPEWHFGRKDLEQVMEAQDQLGYPAVHFTMRADRRDAFGDMTGAHVNDALAILLDGECVTFANIRSRLPGSCIIEGGGQGFTSAEVRQILALLRSGPLPLRPRLVALRRAAE